VEFALKLPVMKDRNLFSKMEDLDNLHFSYRALEKIIDVHCTEQYRYMHCTYFRWMMYGCWEWALGRDMDCGFK